MRHLSDSMPSAKHVLYSLLTNRLLETKAQFDAADIRRLADTLLDIVFHVSDPLPSLPVKCTQRQCPILPYLP